MPNAKIIADNLDVAGLAKDKGLGLFVKTTQEALNDLNDIDVDAAIATAFANKDAEGSKAVLNLFKDKDAEGIRKLMV